MSRVLVHIPMIQYGEYDIFNQPHHEGFLRHITQLRGGDCPNVGNRLWFQGLISVIQSENNQIEFFSPDMSKDYINNSFDCVVAPMANVFSAIYSELLESLAERFRGLKIPVYVIACGLQADSYDQLDDLCQAIGQSATAFISSIYDTGGEFALRGHFTKEFFERLGFSSAVVTGCPSLYQMGRDLQITEEKVSERLFCPLFNGDPREYRSLLNQYQNAEFFDQSVYYHELWNKEMLNQDDDACLKGLIEKNGLYVTELLLQDRIKLIPDMNAWREYLMQRGFSWSYGSRIHGSIMPILAGIPAMLEKRDARTREMAEFFSIPCVEPNTHQQHSLYQMYLETNYSTFNKKFASHFDAYEAFLKRCGIVQKISGKNEFFYPLENMPVTTVGLERREELLRVLERNKTYWRAYEKMHRIKHRLGVLLK